MKEGGEGGEGGTKGETETRAYLFLSESVWRFMATVCVNIRVCPGEEPWKSQVSFWLGEKKTQLTRGPGFQSHVGFRFGGKS